MPGRITAQQLVAQLSHGGREFRAQRGEGSRVLVDLAPYDGEAVRPGERRPTTQQGEQHAAQRIEIRALVPTLGAELLGRPVLGVPTAARSADHATVKVVWMKPAMPKSTTFARPSAVSITLRGLMS